MVESDSVPVGGVEFNNSINCDMDCAIPTENLTGSGWVVGVCPIGGKRSRVVKLAEGTSPQGVICQLCDHAKASTYKIVYKAPPQPPKI